MGIQEILSWYQKKIGTYDKQQWEKTIEQRILHGLTHIPLKTTKPKTDFIDLDLVRGSSFPKAKPKHGIVTVTRLASLRLIFLPWYSKWWVEQTSLKVFALLLLLYILQLVNITVYFYNLNKQTHQFLENVPCSEIIIPIFMMFILSVIHSEIVSTNTGPDKHIYRRGTRRTKIKRRRYTYSNSRAGPDTNSSREKISESGNAESDTASVKILPSKLRIRRNITLDPNEERQPDERSKSKKYLNKICSDNSNLNVQFRLVERDTDEDNRAPLDDDGFESLNGNASSENGDENHIEKKARLNIMINKIENIPSKNNNGESSSGEQSDTESETALKSRPYKMLPRHDLKIAQIECDADSSCCESEAGEGLSSPGIESNCPLFTEATTSATEYMGVTTNSEDCSYSSEYVQSDTDHEMNNNEHSSCDYDLAPTVILNPSCAPSDRVSCTIWENKDIKKADLSVLDISSAIIASVESMPETLDYFYGGVVFSVFLSLVPTLCRLSESVTQSNINGETQLTMMNVSFLVFEKISGSLTALLDAAFGHTIWERTALIISLIERCALSCLFFFLLAVAERTFKQRFLYAKLFSHLTSSRRARKSDVPHFRLNKVRNIKTWLSVRSYLKRRGPQRSVDVIVSTAFIITLLLLAFISMELFKDSVTIHSQYNFEAVLWCVGLGIFLLRFMTLGTKINRKNRNLSVLITEQINLYLQIEQKPHKKDKLMVANSVLKLAADLLKELESPFKISGLSANPYLYNITKVVILSALSGVVSEMLGFKVKLHKINIK